MNWTRRLLMGSGLALQLLLQAAALTGQQVEGGWNDDRVLDLVRRGVQSRSTAIVDPALHSYAAEGRGYVYFLLDAPELDRQTLVRTDQVAVDLYWRAPNQVRQRIVGMREQRELPVTRLHYYLDRLTVVQDNFGQSIVIADGDNVNDVPHPVGETGETHYDYRLADSLTLRLPGVDDPVRVYEVQVRPQDSTSPAVIGSAFLEATSGALVRMTFTFTAAAYVDPRLDFINVTLENGLWQGRFWLPHEQRLEIRREMPELDLPFGTIIRTRMRVGGYRFNEDAPSWFFTVPLPISLAPRDEREAFPFDRPIDAEWRLEGIGQPADVAEIRREARRVLRERAMSGLPRGRMSVGSFSDVVRYNRAEGAALGFGVAVRPLPNLSARIHAGWAIGAGHPDIELDLATGEAPRVSVAAYANRRGDVGGFVPASGAMNTLASLFAASDWSDPFYTSGGRVTTRSPVGGQWSLDGSIGLERQRSALATTSYSVFETDQGFRPVREIDPGYLGSATIGLRREPPSEYGGRWGGISLTGGRLDGDAEQLDFIRGEIEGGVAWTSSEHRARLEIEGRAGATAGDIPRQELYLMGGRGSLPGYPHRAMAGDRFALMSLSGSADFVHPWLRGRLFAALGWTDLSSGAERAAALWDSAPSDGLLPTIGAGFGLYYDLLHLNVARGLGTDGRTQLIIEIKPTFWGFL